MEGYGEGELLSWATSPLTTVSAVKLRIRNGYQRSAELFTANGAVRDLAVRVTGGVEARVTLRRTLGWQEVVIDNHGAPMRGITLEILSTYAGSAYADTCISDVEVYVDAPTDTGAEADKHAAPYDPGETPVSPGLSPAPARGPRNSGFTHGFHNASRRAPRVVRERAEAARAVPVAAYPFAGTRVTRRSEPWGADAWSRRLSGIETELATVRAEPTWSRLAVRRTIPLPEALAWWEYLGASDATAAPVSLGNLLRTSDFTLFSAAGPSAGGVVGDNSRFGYNPGSTSWSSVHAVGDPRSPSAIGWRVTRVVQERGTYVTDLEYVVHYEEGLATYLWIGDASDASVGTLLDLHRDEAGRIDQVDAWTTRRVADGDESVAPLDRKIENEHVVWVVR